LDIAKRFFEGTEGLIVVAFWNGLLEAEIRDLLGLNCL